MSEKATSRLMKWPCIHWQLVGCVAVLLFLTACAHTSDFRPRTPEMWRSELQPPLPDNEAAALATSPTLSQFVTLAMKRNPGMAAARQNWLAAIHRIPQASSPPDPMLELQYPYDLIDGSLGVPRWGLELTQPLPWWNKLWARGRNAGVEADIARLAYEAAARELIIDVKDSAYEIYYMDQAIPITEGIERLLRNQGLLAYGELSRGRTQLSEAFRAESQAAQLSYDRLLLNEQRASQAERLRSLLNLPPETAIGPIRSAPVYEISDDLLALYRRSEEWSEMIRMRGLESARAGYESYLARLSRIPDVTLGMTFMYNGPSGMPPDESGRDFQFSPISVNLPIWEQRNRALIREKEAQQQAMRLQALEETNRVRMGTAEAYFQVRLTERLEVLYRDTLLPQAESVMRQAEIDFRGEQAAFSTVLETTLAWHNFMLAHLRARADHGQAIGRLERILGTTARSAESGEGNHP